MSKRTRRIGAWLAALGLALQALWPLILQAQPRDSVLVPVCSVGAETHYIALDTSKGGDDAAGEHCPQCWIGADRLLITSIPRAFAVPEAGTAGAPALKVFTSRKKPLLLAHPRAPPSLS